MSRPGNATEVQADSYLICATPRTGSTLLCGLLASTGVAGRPGSYFRQPDEQAWATQWKIINPSAGTFSYSEFVQAAILEGRTSNGVFAARIMWGTLNELARKLGEIHSDLAGSGLDLLNRAFGRTRFVYLRRGDIVAQAVSWLRAEQTDVWLETNRDQHKTPGREACFDFDKLYKLVQLIENHNVAWRKWFTFVGVRPYLVRYEELEADPVGVTRGVLDFLGLELPADREIVVQHRRLADELNARWIDRYQARLLEYGKGP